MDRLERFQIMHRELKAGRLNRRKCMTTIEVSHATFKRDLEYLASRLGAPIQFDPKTNYYHYTTAFELPGFWLTDIEIDGLIVMD